MGWNPQTKSALFVAGISVVIGLNLMVLLSAYSASLANLCCTAVPAARDFSAYYEALWRLVYNPSQIYTQGAIAGAPAFFPTIEQYKYLPSFLLVISPLLLLGYPQAISAFDALQFALLPVIAWLVYSLVKEKGLATTFFVAAIVLLLPLPWPGWGLSVPYFWLWKEGQAKVFETFLILCSFYYGKKNRPAISGVFLALSFFDPRFGVVAFPLFVMYNRQSIRAAATWLTAALMATNVVLLYPGPGAGFLGMVLSSGLTTIFYPYALVPLAAIAALWVLNRREVESALRGLISPARRGQ
jgi:hypothetical protein